MNNFYVYAFISKTDNKTVRYIGKGSGTRMAVDTNRKYKVPLKNRKKVATGLTEQEAFNLERFLIALYGRLDISTGTLTNLTDGGEGVSGHKWTEEQRANASRVQTELGTWRGRNHTEKSRNKISKARRKTNGMRGQTHTDENKAKISKAVTERMSKPETRAKSAQVCGDTFRGKPKTEAHKKKLSEIAKVRVGEKNPTSKQYEATDPKGKTYTFWSMSHFCKDKPLHQSAMSRVALGKQTSHNGWTCREI